MGVGLVGGTDTAEAEAAEVGEVKKRAQTERGPAGEQGKPSAPTHAP